MHSFVYNKASIRIEDPSKEVTLQAINRNSVQQSFSTENSIQMVILNEGSKLNYKAVKHNYEQK